MVKVNIELDSETHKLLKLKSVQEDINLKDLTPKMIREGLKHGNRKNTNNAAGTTGSNTEDATQATGEQDTNQ